MEPTDNRYTRYKMNEKAKGRTPLGWGEWLQANQPAPLEGDPGDEDWEGQNDEDEVDEDDDGAPCCRAVVTGYGGWHEPGCPNDRPSRKGAT